MIFLNHFKNSQTLITFNGKRFDEIFVCNKFKITPHLNHFDLMDECKLKGLQGGLKKISFSMQIQRPKSIDDVSGRDAIFLWKNYKKFKNKQYIETLLFYNAWDVLITYKVHMKLLKKRIEQYEDSIPFKV